MRHSIRGKTRSPTRRTVSKVIDKMLGPRRCSRLPMAVGPESRVPVMVQENTLLELFGGAISRQGGAGPC